MIKRTIALVLAVLLVLAAMPALGEDFSGTWYMNYSLLNMGTMELNEDGTGTIAMPVANLEGELTWTADESGVTIVTAGGPQLFPYDGTKMTVDANGMEIEFSRECGKITMEQFMQFMTNQTVPEGVSAEDMTTLMMQFIALSASKSSGSSATETAAPEPKAEAVPALTVLKDNFVVYEDYSGYRALYMAKVQNTSDAPFFLTKGPLTIFDANGSVLASENYFYSRGSHYLEPGEITFCSLSVKVPEGAEVKDYQASMNVDAKSYSKLDRAIPVIGTSFGTEYNSTLLKVTVINESEEPLADISGICALEDAEGNIMTIQTFSLNYDELGPNSSITKVFYTNSDLMKYYEANGITPAQVEAYAYVEIK